MRCDKYFSIKKTGLLRSLELLTGCGVALVTLLGAMLMTVPTHAEQSTIDTVNVTLQTSCTLSGTINTPHAATVVPGVYTQGIGQTTIKAICNDINGFSLYAAGFTDNTVGKTVLASETSSTYDIPTGTATSGTSNWAMKVNSVSGTTAPTIYGSFDDYHSVPSSYTKVAGYGGATDPTDGSSVTTTYALYTTPTQLTGTYSGQVRYVIVHPSTANGYTIVYNANGGTVSPASEVVPLGTSITLPTPTQSGYSFLGWYTAPTGGTKVGDAGDTYSPTENVVIHAQWEEKSSNLFAISTMQEMTSEICANTTTPLASATNLDTDGSHAGDTSYVPSKTLTDTRGGSYVVRKYADGNCWMAQNLNLTLTAGISLTASNTDLNSQPSWDPQYSTSTSVPGNYTDRAASYTRGDKWCYGTASNTSQTCTTTYDGSLMNATNHVGILYNWYAATAGTGTDDMASTSATDTNDATDSICPKGWQLPTGGTSNKTNTSGYKYSFDNLITTSYSIPSGPNTEGSVTMRTAPLSFIISGYYDDDLLYDEGSDGSYWSSSASTDSSWAYYLYFDQGNMDPQSSYDKYVGFSVRCVAR